SLLHRHHVSHEELSSGARKLVNHGLVGHAERFDIARPVGVVHAESNDNRLEFVFRPPARIGGQSLSIPATYPSIPALPSANRFQHGSFDDAVAYDEIGAGRLHLEQIEADHV